jgi:hypothetical protein
MRRGALLAVLAILVGGALLGALIGLVLASPGAEAAGWRSAARKYIAFVSAGQLEVAAAEPASRPWAFRREMSAHSYGTSTYYLVDTRYSDINGSKPLPYPPVEAWCVHLRDVGSSGGVGSLDRLVFIAKREDLYNADWIVHVPIGQASQQEEMLSIVGCR